MNYTENDVRAIVHDALRDLEKANMLYPTTGADIEYGRWLQCRESGYERMERKEPLDKRKASY